MTLDPTDKLSAPPLLSATPRSHVSLVFSWGDSVQAVALREGRHVVVGRAEPANLVIDDRSLSRAHARFSMRDGLVMLEDLESTNGSLLNGERVQRAALGDSDVAQLGTVEVRVSGRPTLCPDMASSLSHATFMRRLDEELERAKLFGRSAAVVALRVENAEAEQTNAPLALRTVDALCASGPRLRLVLLAETHLQAAVSWVQAAQSKLKNTWTAGIASYPSPACTAEELVSLALDALHSAQRGSLLTAVARRPVLADAPIVLSSSMRRLYDLAQRAARTTIPVLILGETGSGKELVARAVHDKSPRAGGPFKAVNCATVPTTLVESVLFGHERGAFTGADRQTQGVFEQAQGGSVFLDEIGELAPQAQAALLRVVEQRRIVRVGGMHEIEVDVRVIAATHRDLAAMVVSGTFREDLLFRLDALSLRVPPLRERREEIGPLAELFLRRARQQWGACATGFSEEALDALGAYAWPGNVRQLKNVVERAVAVCSGPWVELEDLPEQVWAEPPSQAAEPARESEESCDSPSLPDRMRAFEIALIREAMERAHGNQAHAARMLGVPRRTLANKVHSYRLLDGDG